MIFQILNNIIAHGLNQWRNTKGRKTRDGSVPRKYLSDSFILTGKAFASDMMFSLKVKSCCSQSEKQSVRLCFHWSSVRAAKGQHCRILENDHLFWIISFYLMAAYGLITTCKGRILQTCLLSWVLQDFRLFTKIPFTHFPSRWQADTNAILPATKPRGGDPHAPVGGRKPLVFCELRFLLDPLPPTLWIRERRAYTFQNARDFFLRFFSLVTKKFLCIKEIWILDSVHPNPEKHEQKYQNHS